MTLSPVDMVLHAILHLLHDGDLSRGFRDFIDVAELLQHMGSQEAFWRQLFDRAEELGADRPLFYSLRYSQSLLGVVVPPVFSGRLERLRPPAPILLVMDALVPRAILPAHLEKQSRSRRLAGLLLYVRSHWLRMPPLLLVRHLVHQIMDRVMPG